MVLWIVGGYCLAAVIFYSYLVATAKPDPTETAAAAETGSRGIESNRRKAA